MPGPAVRLFAATFGAHLTPLATTPGCRPIARCELHSRKAEAATRRLLPYLLAKREQAMLLLQVGRVREQTNRRSDRRFERLEAIRHLMDALHVGVSRNPQFSLSAGEFLPGYQWLGPREIGWTGAQVRAYLAGIMDSDGNFRIEKRRVRRMLHPQYRIAIRCAQVQPSPAIELLRDTFGGSVSPRRSRHPNHRDLATWNLQDRAAAPAVKALLPHLIVKQTEAWLLLELRGLKEEGKAGATEWTHANRWHEQVKMRKRCYTPSQVAGFERLYREIQDQHSGAARIREPPSGHRVQKR